MKKMRRWMSTLVGVSLLAGLLAGCESGEVTPPPSGGTDAAPQTSAGEPLKEGQTELKWYQPEPDGHPWTDVSYLIGEEIEKGTDGAFKVTIYPGGSLGTQAEAVNMLRTGSLALLTSGPSILASFYDPVQVVSLPYIFDTPAEAYQFLESDLGQEIFNETILNASGVRTLDFWYFGNRQLTTKGIPATKPEDLAGAKIRSMDTPVAKTVVTGLGGSPVPINISELYMAMQTGVVQGQENPVPTIMAQKFYEVQDNLILTNHSVHMGTVHVSEMIWKTFTEDQQKVVTDALAKYRPEIEERINTAVEEGIEEMKANGVNVIEPDIEAFKASAQKAIEAQYGDDEEWMKVIQAVQDMK